VTNSYKLTAATEQQTDEQQQYWCHHCENIVQMCNNS